MSLRNDELRWVEPVSAARPAVPPSAVPWREVRWIGFAGAFDPSASADEDPGQPTAAGIPSAPVAEGAVAAAGQGRSLAGAAQVRRRAAAGMRRLLWLGATAASVGVVAVVLYHGGERLARLAGATPRPAAAPERPVAALAGASETGNAAARYLDRAKAGDPVAQYNLAVLYVRGDGLARDLAAAASWFYAAAQGGNLAAQFNLGVIYQRGLGVAPNPDAAISWYQRAASRDYPAAEYNLALAYAEGRGTPQDWVAAARWYHQAALQGLVPAMVNFAILYEKGEGVGRSLSDAYAWYRAAARRGDRSAERRAAELLAQSSGSQKAEAVMQAAAVVDALHDAESRPRDSTVGPFAAPAGPPPVLKTGGGLGLGRATDR